MIIPVVLYHGRTPWSAPLSFESLVDVPRDLEEIVKVYVPSFRYLVDDLSRVVGPGRLCIACERAVKRCSADLSV